MKSTCTIELDNAYIYAQVRKTAAYIADKDGTDEGFDIIALYKQHEEVLESLTYQARNLVAKACGRYIKSENDSTDKLTLKLEIVNGNESISGHINKAAVEYCINYILAGWMSIVKPESAEQYTSKASASMKDLRDLLTHRNVPKRSDIIPMYDPSASILVPEIEVVTPIISVV